MSLLWDLTVALAVLIIVVAFVLALINMLWPRKWKPDEYDDPASWGNQDFDSRRARKTRK